MSDKVDNIDTKEEPVLGDSGSSSLGSKSSSFKITDEQGNLLWSPDDIGIYSEVRTSVIAYIIEKLINKADFKLKVEDVGSQWATQFSNDIADIREQLARLPSQYLSVNTENLNSLLVPLATSVVENAVQNYIDRYEQEDSSIIASTDWVQSFTGNKTTINNLNSPANNQTLFGYIQEIKRVLSKVVLSCFITNSGSISGGDKYEKAYDYVKSDENVDVTTNNYNVLQRVIALEGLSSRVANLENDTSGIKGDIAYIIPDNSNLWNNFSDIIARIINMIGAGTQDGPSSLFLPFSTEFSQVLGSDGNNLIAAVNTLYTFVSDVSGGTSGTQAISRVLNTLATLYSQGNIFTTNTYSNFISNSNNETSTVKVPSSYLFNSLYTTLSNLISNNANETSTSKAPSSSLFSSLYTTVTNHTTEIGSLVEDSVSTSTSKAPSSRLFKSLNDKIPSAPSSAGTYTLKCTVTAGGSVSYSWVADAP